MPEFTEQVQTAPLSSKWPLPPCWHAVGSCVWLTVCLGPPSTHLPCVLSPPACPAAALPCSAAFLKERLFDQSDAYRVHVCERSGLIAVANLKKQHYHSQIYNSDSQVVQVRALPYYTSASAWCVCGDRFLSADVLSRWGPVVVHQGLWWGSQTLLMPCAVSCVRIVFVLLVLVSGGFSSSSSWHNQLAARCCVWPIGAVSLTPVVLSVLHYAAGVHAVRLQAAVPGVDVDVHRAAPAVWSRLSFTDSSSSARGGGGCGSGGRSALRAFSPAAGSECIHIYAQHGLLSAPLCWLFSSAWCMIECDCCRSAAAVCDTACTQLGLVCARCLRAGGLSLSSVSCVMQGLGGSTCGLYVSGSFAVL